MACALATLLTAEILYTCLMPVTKQSSVLMGSCCCITLVCIKPGSQVCVLRWDLVGRRSGLVGSVASTGWLGSSLCSLERYRLLHLLCAGSTVSI